MILYIIYIYTITIYIFLFYFGERKKVLPLSLASRSLFFLFRKNAYRFWGRLPFSSLRCFTILSSYGPFSYSLSTIYRYYCWWLSSNFMSHLVSLLSLILHPAGVSHYYKNSKFFNINLYYHSI